MIRLLSQSTNLRLLLPETIWLEPEHFDQAKQIHNSLSEEPQQWQAYLNALALLGFEAWLREQLQDRVIERGVNAFDSASYLHMGEFKLCLLTTEHVLDDVVHIPQSTLQAEHAAHFYVVLEVLEEEEQVLIRGFLRYDELIAHFNQTQVLAQEEKLCLLPLSSWDAEINHLVHCVRYLDASAFSLPSLSTQPTEVTAVQETTTREDLPTFTTRLSQWLQSALDEGWQTLDTLINPEASLAFNLRHLSASVKGGKLINFGVQLGNQAVALLVTVTEAEDEKIRVGIQVLPTGGESFLPPNLKLTLLSGSGIIQKEVISRSNDIYIQLNSFQGKPGTTFSIEVSLNGVEVREAFEL